MKTMHGFAVMLIVMGVLALAYGGFNYTMETHAANLGSMSLLMEDREPITGPVLAGVSGLMIGGLIFVFGRSPR